MIGIKRPKQKSPGPETLLHLSPSVFVSNGSKVVSILAANL